MNAAIVYEMVEPAPSRQGTGQTLWMSRSEVAFLAKGPGGLGDKIVLHLEWPVLLAGVTPMQLLATAEIVQCSGPVSVARLTRYEFRTRGADARSMGARRRLPLLTPETLPARPFFQQRTGEGSTALSAVTRCDRVSQSSKQAAAPEAQYPPVKSPSSLSAAGR